MSADNLAVCPKCHKKREEAKAAAYGKIPEAEYLKMVTDKKPTPTDLEEHYTIGVESSGEFEATYRGVCIAEGCGFEFKHSVKIDALKAFLEKSGGK